MNHRVDLDIAQQRLAVVWLIGAGVVFVVVAIQTMNAYPPFPPEKEWQWLLPSILPTLSLIVSTIVLSARANRTPATVDQFAFHVSLGLSIFYLALVASVPLVPPFLQMTAPERIELLDRSRLWLAPVQSLVAIALGAFFVSKEPAQPPTP